MLHCVQIPHYLKSYHVLYDEPVIFQLVPSLMLSYESWRAKKPQLLWPPLISVSYCISLQTALWSCCYAILCIILAFRTGINRFKCISVTFFILILVFSAQDTAFHRGQAKQPDKARIVVKIT